METFNIHEAKTHLSRLIELPIASEHVIAVSRLAHDHCDPFNRLLVAQAEVEGLTLMTTDKKMAQYGAHVRRF